LFWLINVFITVEIPGKKLNAKPQERQECKSHFDFAFLSALRPGGFASSRSIFGSFSAI
jgi:hypothetical protein